MKKIILTTSILSLILIYIGCTFPVKEASPCSVSFEESNIGATKNVQRSYAIPSLEGGSMVATTSNGNLFLLNVNEFGEDDTFSSSVGVGEVVMMVQSPIDSSYTICANSGDFISLVNVSMDFIVRGTFSFQSHTGGNECKCNSLTLTNNGSYIIGGQIDGANAYVARVTTTENLGGNTVTFAVPWNSTVIESSDTEINYAEETDNGDIIAVGYIFPGGSELDTYFLKYEDNNTVPSIRMPYNHIAAFEAGTHIVKKDNNYLIGGNVIGGNDDFFLMEIEDDGDLVFPNNEPIILGGGNDDHIFRIHINNGDIFVSGYTESTEYGASEDNPNLFVAKLNNNNATYTIEGKPQIYNDATLVNNPIPSSEPNSCGLLISGVTTGDDVYLISTDLNF